MANVYQIYMVDGFQQLIVSDYEEYGRNRELYQFLYGHPITGPWVPLPIRIDQPRRKKPDIWQFDGAWLFEPTAATHLTSFCAPYGQVFPQPFQDRELTLFYPTTILDCVDPENYNADTGSLAFHANRITAPIFRIPGSTYIFVSQGILPGEHDFKSLVERHKLKGLLFGLIWSDEK